MKKKTEIEDFLARNKHITEKYWQESPEWLGKRMPTEEENRWYDTGSEESRIDNSGFAS